MAGKDSEEHTGGQDPEEENRDTPNTTPPLSSTDHMSKKV